LIIRRGAMKIKIICVLFLCVLFLFGCAAVSQFDPIIVAPSMTVENGEYGNYAVYDSDKISIKAGLNKWEDFILVDLLIVNNSLEDIAPDKYAVWVFDGKDEKPLGFYDEEALKNIRSILIASKTQEIPAAEYEYKYSGSSYYSPYTNSVTSYGSLNKQQTAASSGAQLGAALGNIIGASSVRMVLDKVIDKYFAFRTIGANDSRGGYLCFRAEFKLEYPLTLAIVINGEPIKLRFNPKS
jgi:hypothetical protein